MMVKNGAMNVVFALVLAASYTDAFNVVSIPSNSYAVAIHSAVTKTAAPKWNKNSSELFAVKKGKKSKGKGKGKNIKVGRSTGKGFGQPGTKEVVSNLATKTMDDASTRILGQALNNAQVNTKQQDEFWEIIPALIHSRFPQATDLELKRIAGMMSYTLDPEDNPVEASIVDDPYRPHQDIHAYMPNLGSTKPFHDPNQLRLCKLLRENYDTIVEEYHALLEKDAQDRFQSVTSMNYDSGWKTMVLFYNGHRIDSFPYHLCPVTTKILETVPLAGRIAGFNRQSPNSGIPLHSDGNNMWLTCQMGIHVPSDHTKAWIRVGPETRNWKNGECLLYDTTYEHETFNESLDEERVVLHVDFFNTLEMTELEIDIMTYIYDMKEKFMKAEGVTKVGSQIL